MTAPFSFTDDAATIGSAEYSFPTDSTTLTAQTTDGYVSAVIDASAMLAGDRFQFRVYETVNGGSQLPIWEHVAEGAQSLAIVTPTYQLGTGWNITAKKLAGTDRSIGWTIRFDGGDRNVTAWKGTAPSDLIAGRVDANVGAISSDSTAADNLESAFDGTGYVNANGPALYRQVANIAVTGAALNQTAASRTLTSGSGSGGVANTKGNDGTYDTVDDSAGAIDFYYEFDVSTTEGAVGVSAEWQGYVAGVVNTIKVYAWDWGATAYVQVGTILGIAGAVNETEEWALTSAHTENGLVRIRFANTGLTSASVKTDRVLLGYAVVAPPAPVPGIWIAGGP